MWMDHQANSSAACKQMSWRALLPDIQRHRQNDGLKNDLCEPRPVLQRAKASSDQSCLLTSASSEGEGGRASVASVSERARASEGVSSLCGKERVVQQKSDFPSVEVFVLCCSVDGAPPQGRMQIFSDLHTREDPVLVTTPLNHTYRLHFLIL